MLSERRITYRVSENGRPAVYFSGQVGTSAFSGIPGFCKRKPWIILRECAGWSEFFSDFRPFTMVRPISASAWENVPSDVRPTKTQISLRVCAVWSESSLSAWRNFASLAIQNAPSEESDQTARMRRLIWIFAGRTSPKERFSTLRHF